MCACVFGSGTLGFSHDSLDNSELDPLKPLRASGNNEKPGELCSCVTLTAKSVLRNLRPMVSVHLPPIKHKGKYPKSLSIKNLSQKCHV